MLLEPPTARIGYPTSDYACETLGGPFVAGTGGETLSYASMPALRISLVCIQIVVLCVPLGRPANGLALSRMLETMWD